MPDLSYFFGTLQIHWIVALITIDVMVGIIAAIVNKEFKLGKLANFMKKGVLAYVLGFAVLEILAWASTPLNILVRLAFILIVLALIGSILNNLGKLGVNIPSYLKRD